MDVVNPNYLNYMEQIQKNRKDIDELFERGLFNYKGEWNSDTTYNKNDCVKFDNSLYIYKLDNSSKGIPPTNTNYWDLFSADTGTLVYDVNNNSLSSCSFSGHNGINVDMDEDNPNDFNIRLDYEISNKIAKSLVTPISTPSEKSFVMIGTNNAQDNVSQSDIFKTIYPVGSIYISTTETSPASFIGGTWEKIQDKFLLASGSYALGTEGGSTSHNHTLLNGYAEIGYSWLNNLNYSLAVNIVNKNFQADLRTSQDASYEDGSTWGQSRATALGGTTDNTETLPPYLVVNIWKRIA